MIASGRREWLVVPAVDTPEHKALPFGYGWNIAEIHNKKTSSTMIRSGIVASKSVSGHSNSL